MSLNTSHFFVLLCMIGFVQACSNTGPGKPNELRINLDPSYPSVVLLGQRHVTQHATEFDFVSCVRDYLVDNNPNLNVIPEQQFIDDLYPFFERSTAPLHISNFQQVAQHSVVREKFKQMNLRYLVWIFGDTDTVNQSGSMSCAVGPVGGGCFGYKTWHDEAQYDAQVWNVENLSHAGSASTQNSGTSYMPAVVVPIPILAGVRSEACDMLALRIERHIVL